MANVIDPWKSAMKDVLYEVLPNSIENDTCVEAWAKIHELSTVECEICPTKTKQIDECHFVGCKISSFGNLRGYFSCALKNKKIKVPRFSDETPRDLRVAIMKSLYGLAPGGAHLEVLLEDDVNATNSTLAEAGLFTEAGWGLNPANTELISEEPRRWIFRFMKN